MHHPWSIARRLVVAQLLGVLVITVFAAWASFVHTRDTVHRLESDRMLATARLVAQEYEVIRGFHAQDPSAVLQPLSLEIAQNADVSWVTFLTTDGERLAHWIPEWVGTTYSGSISPAREGTAFTETSTTGQAGPSVRALVPVRDLPDDGSAPTQDTPILGVVAVGQRVTQLDILARSNIPALLVAAALVIIGGLLASAVLHRYLHRVTLGLGPEQLAERFTFLDTALHNVTEGMLLISQQRLRLYNDRAAELLGLPEPGTRALTVDQLEVPAPLLELLTSGRPAEDELFAAGHRLLVVNQRPARPHRRRRALPFALTRGAGRPEAPGTVVTLLDHTDVQEMNRELASTRSLTDALRSQTHEHANRLHTVLSMLELGHTQQARDFLVDSVEQGGGAGMESLQTGAEPAVVALLMAKSAQARERGVSLEHRVLIDRPTGISAQDLVTVLGNLVDNAIDAVLDPTLPTAQRWVDVEARLEEGWLVLQVADGGSGLSEQDRERVFELGWSTKPQGVEGRGVGLALVRQTAHRLCGAVEVAVDSGTVFTVELPAGGPEEPQDDWSGEGHA